MVKSTKAFCHIKIDIMSNVLVIYTIAETLPFTKENSKTKPGAQRKEKVVKV